MKKVFFFHSTLNTPSYMKPKFASLYPNAELYNIVDDSILGEIRGNGFKHTPDIVKRLIEYGRIAEGRGACVMVNMCTTLAEAVREAQKALNIPFLTIDGPMLHKAVTQGNKIAVIVTADTTIEPSTRAAKMAALDEKRDVMIDTIYVDGAFHAITVEGNQEKHDQLVVSAVKKAAEDHDVIVLAQVTMAETAAKIGEISVPVLTSPESGLEQLRKFLKD